MVRALWRQKVEGPSANGARGRGKAGEGGGCEGSEGATIDGPLQLSDLTEALEACVRPSMKREAIEALAAQWIDALGSRYAPLRDLVLEACASTFRALGSSASPGCDELLRTLGGLYADVTLGASRPLLLSSLGAAAKAVGPEAFLAVLPLRVSTEDAAVDTSWVLAALRGHVGNARLGHFGEYFVPLSQWLEKRAGELAADSREIESRNLRNLYEQVWALLPGYAVCARDVEAALPPIARLMGVALAERPEVRSHVLQGLTMLIMSARSRKEPVPKPDGSGVVVQLTAEAQAALSTVGRFGKNFLPLLFNVQEAEPPEKRPALQEAVRAIASVTPAATVGELFKQIVRKLLEPVAAAATAEAAAGGTAASDSLETQRSMLDLLTAICPALEVAHAAILYRAVKPLLLSTDILLQKKGYKLIACLCEHHPAYVSSELSSLREALAEALPLCLSGAKGKRLACLQAIATSLPSASLRALLQSLIGEVVLACKELNVKTRAAAFEFLLNLVATGERRAADEAAKAAATRSLLVMIAGGLAGNSAHMIAASLAALGRLTFEMRGRPALEPTLVQLFATVLTLLGHKAQEVRGEG